MEKPCMIYFEAMLATHREIFEAVNNLDVERFNQKPDEKSWSIAQIMEHLYLAEEFSLSYMSKKMKARDKLKKAGLSSFFKSKLLNACLRSSVKFKAPSLTNPSDNQYKPNDFTAQWMSHDEKFKQYLSDFPAELVYVEIFKHPVAGKLNMIQTLQFMSIHAQRHKNQILNRLA
jgi:uncharacterized damage-inducible protein DinB